MITMEELQGYPVADDKEIRDAHNKAVSLIEHNVDEFFDCFPGANSENNFYRQTENTDWTEGFWTGELWLAYESNKDDKLKEAALCQVDNFLYRIEHHINTDHHDMGFLYSPSCVAAYKLTGSEVGKRAALLAADNLMKRFHEKGQFFQAWGKIGDKDNYRLIIDCLMNMPLLFWASKVTGDKKYEEKAQAHIKTAMENIVRDDNSTYHTYFFDMETGKPTKGVTCQGNRDGSAWARGQAWGIYGSAVAYSKTGNKEYLDIFKRVTKYFMEHLPKDLVPYWDFDFDTGSDEPRDSSAGVILIKMRLNIIHRRLKDCLKQLLIIVLLKTVKSLTDFYFTVHTQRKHRIIHVITAVLMSVIHGEIISIWRHLHV